MRLLTFIRNRLQAKLVLAFTVVLLVPAVIVTFYLLDTTSSALRDVEELRQKATLDENAEDIVNILTTSESDTLFLSRLAIANLSLVNL